MKRFYRFRFGNERECDAVGTDRFVRQVRFPRASVVATGCSSPITMLPRERWRFEIGKTTNGPINSRSFYTRASMYEKIRRSTKNPKRTPSNRTFVSESAGNVTFSSDFPVVFSRLPRASKNVRNGEFPPPSLTSDSIHSEERVFYSTRKKRSRTKY